MPPKEEAPPVYDGDACLPGRPMLRKFFSNIRVEFAVTGLVIINMIMLLVDMIITEDSCPIYGNTSYIRTCLADFAEDEMQIQWTAAFQWMELVFLSTFTIEIFIRIYAYGLSHFFDALNIVDAIIVFA